MNEQYMGCGCDTDSVGCGQLAAANELGCDPSEVGLDLNPVHLVKKVTKGAAKMASKIPGVSLATTAAHNVLRSAPLEAMHDIVKNPIVSTVLGNVAVPTNLALAALKGGPQGALNAAKQELRNPVRAAAVSAASLIFPPLAPAAAGLVAANRVLDASEKGSPAEKAKAIAQIAATYALAESGNVGAQKGVEFLNQAKKIRPPAGLAPALDNPRLEVCGAKAEESKGVWMKLHFFREGTHLCAVLYSVAGGEAEVSRFSVNLVPIIAYVKKLHDRLHGNTVGAMPNVMKVATKMATSKLKSAATATSRKVAVSAKCSAMQPPIPVSNESLALFSAAKKGVEVIEQQKKLDGALRGTAESLKRYSTLKDALDKMSPDAKAAALRDPNVKKAIIDGVGAKIAAAKFISSGGPAKAKALRAKADLARSKFDEIARNTKSTNPTVSTNAKKMARVVAISAKAREKVKNAALNSKGGAPGIVVGPRGRLIRGKFSRRTPKSGEVSQVILTKLGLEKGIFEKVSGYDLVGHQKSALADRYRRRLAAIRKLARVGAGTNPFLALAQKHRKATPPSPAVLAKKKAALMALIAKKNALPIKSGVPVPVKAALKSKIASLRPETKAKLAKAVVKAKKKVAVKKAAKKHAVKKKVAAMSSKEKQALLKKIRTLKKKRAMSSNPQQPIVVNVPGYGPTAIPAPQAPAGAGPSPYEDEPLGPGGLPPEMQDDQGYEDRDSIDPDTYVEDEFVSTDDEIPDAEDTTEDDLEGEDEAVEGLLRLAGGY